MKVNLYSIFDSKLATYGKPWYELTDAAAIRAFADAVADSSTRITNTISILRIFLFMCLVLLMIRRLCLKLVLLFLCRRQVRYLHHEMWTRILNILLILVNSFVLRHTPKCGRRRLKRYRAACHR